MFRLPYQQYRRALYRLYSSGRVPDWPVEGLSNLAKALLTDVERIPKEEKPGKPGGLLPSFPPMKPNTDDIKITPLIDTETSTGKMKLGWTAHEKQRLLMLTETHRGGYRNAIDWEQVQQQFPGRTLIACKSMYYVMRGSEKRREQEMKRVQPGQQTKISLEERAMLQDAVVLFGEHSWTRVCDYMQERVGFRRLKTVYRNLWFRVLCPRAKTAPKWTAEREERLRELAALHGPDEVFLAYKFFPEYTPWFLGEKLAQIKKSK